MINLGAASCISLNTPPWLVPTMAESSSPFSKPFHDGAPERERYLAIEQAYLDAIFELNGPKAAATTCDDDVLCKANRGKVSVGGSSLFGDLERLSALDGGHQSDNFSADLDALNARLKYFGAPLPIAGIDQTRKRVLFGKPSDAFYELTKEPGLVTLKPAADAGTTDDTPISRNEPKQTEHRRAANLGDFVPDEVNEGFLATCYFVSPAASLAEANPDQLRRMITNNGDGTYSVTFPGDAANTYTVNEPNQAEQKLFTHGAQWIEILEKAQRLRSGKNLMDDGGHAQEGLELLSGARIGTLRFPYLRNLMPQTEIEELTRKVLTNAMQKKAPLVADSSSNAPNGLVPSHTYSVLSFDAQADLVTVRNPYGPGLNSREQFPMIRPAVFQMPLKAFVQDFFSLITVRDAIPGA